MIDSEPKESRPCKEQRQIDSKELADIAIFLEGLYLGKGNVLPLGKIHIENLWNAVHYTRDKKCLV